MAKTAAQNRRIYITAAILILLAVAVTAAVINIGWLGRFFTDLFYLKYLPDLKTNVSLWTLLVFGLLTSVHCMGMCGGLVLSQCVKAEEAGNKGDTVAKGRGRALIPSAFYNAGRLVSYTLIGGVVGGVGQVLSLPRFLKGLIPIAGGAFMIIMAVNLLGIFPQLRRLNIRPPKFIAKKVLKGSGKSPFAVGLMTGLMPCGPLQIVELYALSTRNVFYGAASMFIFALGTVPGLFAFGAAGSLLGRRFQSIVLRISAMVVALLGIIMIGRGLSLEGVTLPGLTGGAKAQDGFVQSEVIGSSQTVTIKIGENYFPPIEVKDGIPVRWVIHADKDAYCDCNNEIVVRAFSIDKKLVVGDNVVYFTPHGTGDYVYTCWMGMIKSKIRVVEADSADSAGKTSADARLSVSTNHADKNDSSCTSSCAASGACASSSPAHTASSAASSPAKGIPQNSSPAAPTSSTQGLVTLTGYIIDEDCFVRPEFKNPADETGGCLTMASCAASGYGLAVKQSDGSYRFYYFDGTFAKDVGEMPDGATGGQKTAWNFINAKIPDGNIAVTVKGKLSGASKTNPDAESADGKYYSVFSVSSISIRK